jgi:outer membrane protein, multidrug efflux system
MRPPVHDALDGAVPGQAGEVEGTGILHIDDAERSLFNAELSHAQTQNDVIQALINTYKAMGGGWTEVDKLAGGRRDPWMYHSVDSAGQDAGVVAQSS